MSVLYYQKDKYCIHFRPIYVTVNAQSAIQPEVNG